MLTPEGMGVCVWEPAPKRGSKTDVCSGDLRTVESTGLGHHQTAECLDLVAGGKGVLLPPVLCRSLYTLNKLKGVYTRVGFGL